MHGWSRDILRVHDHTSGALPSAFTLRPSMLDVNVEWYGTCHTFRMRSDSNVAALKERLAHATGVPRADLSVAANTGVCNDKSLLRGGEETAADTVTLSSPDLTDGEATAVEFTAWGRRYSMHRSEAAARLVRTRELAAQRRTKAAVADAWVVTRDYLRALPRRTWLYIVVWLVLGRCFKYIGFGAPPPLSPACAQHAPHSARRRVLPHRAHQHGSRRRCAILHRVSHVPDVRQPRRTRRRGSLCVHGF